MPHQCRQIARPVAQRWQLNGNHIQAEEQILAEAAVGHRAGEILVGGGQNAHVDLDRLAATHAFDFARFDGAQQLGLRLGTEVAYFVEKERAGVREFEAAETSIRGAGERAALVPEHLAFHEVTRNGRTVHPNERTIAPGTGQMQRGRHELFARARFAGDQHARVGRAHPRNERPYVVHHRRVAHHLARNAEVLAERGGGPAGLTQLERRGQCQQHAFWRERLLKEREGAEFGGAHRVGERGASTHHDDRHVGPTFTQLLQQREPVEIARHHQVHEGDIGLVRVREGEPGGSVGGVAHIVSLGAQQGADHASDVRFVVDDQDTGHIGASLPVRVDGHRDRGRTLFQQL